MNPHPLIFSRRSLLTGAVLALTTTLAPSLQAANGTWQGASGTQLWATTTNWTGATPPGSTASTTSTEVATFNSATPGTAITIDANRNLKTLTFDTAAGNFTLGSAGANGGNALLLTIGGTTSIASTFTGSGITETVNAPLSIQGTAASYNFSSASTDNSNVLNIAGGISGGTAASTVGLTFGGANVGANIASGVIANGSSTVVNITKSGAGTWAFSGANTYTGTTTLTGGILSISSDAKLGTAPGTATAGQIVIQVNSSLLATSSFTLNSNRGITLGAVAAGSTGTIAVASGATVTYGGVMANNTGGTDKLLKTGMGTLVLTGTNTYTGSTLLQQGTLKLDFSAAGAPTTNILNTAAFPTFGTTAASATSSTLAVVGKASTANSQTFTGTTSLSSGASHLNLTAGVGGSLTVGLGTLGARGFGQTLDIALGANTVVTTSSTNTAVNGGTLPAALITINGNDFGTINGLGQIVGLSTVGGAYTSNTATTLGTTGQVIDMTTAATTLSTNSAALGDMRFNTAADTTLTLNPNVFLVIGGGNAAAGQILVTSNVGNHLSKITGGVIQGTKDRDFVITQNNTAGDLQLDAVITDFLTTANPFTKAGAGKVIVTAGNAYQGATYVNEGTLVVTGNYLPANSQTLTATNGTSTITGVDTTGLFVGERVAGTTASGAFITGISGTTVTLNASTTVATGSTSITFGGAGGLGTNTATGVQVAGGATLQIGNGGTSGSLMAGQGILNSGAVILNRSDDITFANVISGNNIMTGYGTLAKQGAGKATLTGGNSYLGGTTISAGTLSISSLANGAVASNIGSSSNAASNLVLDGGTLQYTGAAQITDRLFTLTNNGGAIDASSASNAALTLNNTGAVAFSGSGARTLILTGTSTGANTLAAVIGTGAGGATSVTKTGTGTWTLSGTNTYAGPTTIKGGTLKLASATSNNPIGSSSSIIVGDSLANNSAVLDVTGVSASGGFKVQSGQTLAGHGTVLGDTTFLSGSILSPGNSAGTTTYNGNLALSSGTSLVFDLASVGASDKVLVTGSGHLLTLNNQSISDFTFNLLGGFGAGTYTLFDSSANGILGSLNSNPANLTEMLGGYNATLSLNAGNVILTVAVVPEPGTWAMMLGGLAMLVTIQRRKSKVG